jgi:CheY-like chemotaxis protein
MNIPLESGRHFVLVVDSDCHRGRRVQLDLKAKGCYATFVSSGQEALRFVRENEPDAVLSDWALTDMAGPELARQIKCARFATRVILEKDDVDWRALRQAYEVAADDLLSRSQSSGQVLSTLERTTNELRRRPREAHPRPELVVEFATT